jgi:hypothetical protein
MIVLSIIVLLVVTYYRMGRSAIACIICYAVLPKETSFDAQMFFITWSIFATLISLPWQFWLGFVVGHKLGNR